MVKYNFSFDTFLKKQDRISVLETTVDALNISVQMMLAREKNKNPQLRSQKNKNKNNQKSSSDFLKSNIKRVQTYPPTKSNSGKEEDIEECYNFGESSNKKLKDK